MALVLALSACGGNSLDPDDTGTDTGTDTDGGTDGEVTTSTPVTVPTSLSNNLISAKVIPGTDGDPDTLLVAISGLDTTPIDATWERKPSLDIPGYQAYFIQEDALDRLFVGLAASSADGSVSAVVAGDGGQFNTFYSGAQYERVGGYTPPDATLSGPGTGQVSYKGKYAGLLNGGGGRDEAIPIPPERDTDPQEIPEQPAQVTGDVFVNANFADNLVNGVIKNRTADVDGFSTNLESVVLAPADIAANGTFEGGGQRPAERDPDKQQVGTYGGVFGGTDASSIAGAISIDEVYLADVDPDEALIDNALERGVFVLDQCGLTATADGDCLGTAPTP